MCSSIGGIHGHCSVCAYGASRRPTASLFNAAVSSWIGGLNGRQVSRSAEPLHPSRGGVGRLNPAIPAKTIDSHAVCPGICTRGIVSATATSAPVTANRK
jgi:hypothetical protein